LTQKAGRLTIEHSQDCLFVLTVTFNGGAVLLAFSRFLGRRAGVGNGW